MAPLKKTYELDSNSYSYNSEAIVPTIVTNVVYAQYVEATLSRFRNLDQNKIAQRFDSLFYRVQITVINLPTMTFVFRYCKNVNFLPRTFDYVFIIEILGKTKEEMVWSSCQYSCLRVTLELVL